MDSLIETMKTIIETADPIHTISLQAFMYGILCMIQESQENTKWITLEPSEIMEYSEDFNEFPMDGFESLYSHLDELKNGPLPSKNELEVIADKLIEYANETFTVNIFTTLINGCLLTESQWDSIHKYIEPPPQEQSQEQPQETQQPSQEPSQEQTQQTQPTQQTQSKKKRFAITRCVSGRRSITPIKRRNGHKAISRHKTRTSRV